MPDPLTSLSLAACIAQLLEFGFKFVSEMKEISEHGSSIDVAHLKYLTTDLVDIQSSLKDRGQNAARTGMLSREEQGLKDLALQCDRVAQELLQALNKVTFPKGLKKLQSVRAAVVTYWKKGELNGLAQKLNEYRQQLYLRLFLALNSQGGQDRGRLEQAREPDNEIVEVVAISSGRLRSELKEQYDHELDLAQKDRLAAEIRQAETIAAIFTSRDGINRTIIRKPSKTNFQAPDMIQSATTYRRTGFAGGQALITAVPGFSSNDFTHVSKKLLDSLYFRTIYDRRELIPKAHQNTCEWIFRDPELHEKPWDSFIDWLRNGQGHYWVCGKAGSGKSTLLKYIQSDRRTLSVLEEWAGTSELLVCSFYFSIAGTPLQKSYAGLLRSLLFQILSRKQELLPLAFPDLCRLILRNPTSNDVEPSFVELKTAFRNTIARLADESKVCIFVDGLDEYDGQDYDEVCELFSEITIHSSVKIVVSSRPIPVCVEAFSKCAKLRLQDLTHDDIMLYVKDKVANHPLMARLNDMEKGASDQLTAEITSKASGVFLWVVLVTKSLLNGLRNYDHTSDLLYRLKMLPDDLEKLYSHMLSSVGTQYREQCSRILQVVLRSIRIESDFPMTVLQLSFIEEKDTQKALGAPLRSLPQPEEDWLFEATEGRLRSRCGGLVEVQDLKKFDDGHKSGNSVGFLHRSVIDYLLSGSTWDTICSWAPMTSLDVDLALLSSCLYEMKVKKPDPKLPLGDSRAYGCILRTLAYFSKMGILQSSPSVYLNQLIRTAEEYWPDASPTNAAESERTATAISDGCRRFQLAYPTSFLFSVACQGPSRLLQELLKSYSNGTNRFPAYLLVQFFENMPRSVHRAIAASMKIFSPSSHLVYDVFRSTVKSLNAHWKHIVRCDYRDDWSLIKYALYRCFLLGESDDTELRNFVESGGTEPLFDILHTLVSSGYYTQVGITVLFRGDAERIEGKYEVTGSDIIRHLSMRVSPILQSISLRSTRAEPMDSETPDVHSVHVLRSKTDQLITALETRDSGLRVPLSTTRYLLIFSRLNQIHRIEDYYRVYRS